MVHPGEHALEALALGALTTAESLRIQRHAFNCPGCLRKLIEIEAVLAIEDELDPPFRLRPDMDRPIFLRHDTADGFVYSQVLEQNGKWLERHWGNELAGQHECSSLAEANAHAIAGFEQMFPEHRCTDRCCINPVELETAGRGSLGC